MACAPSGLRTKTNAAIWISRRLKREVQRANEMYLLGQVCTQRWLHANRTVVVRNARLELFRIGWAERTITSGSSSPFQEDPACGWCDDGSNRGTGTCMPGGFSGPVTKVLNVRTELICPNQQWFFTSCPPCQCNGHSTCIEGTQKCSQPCLHLTEGI